MINCVVTPILCNNTSAPAPLSHGHHRFVQVVACISRGCASQLCPALDFRFGRPWNGEEEGEQKRNESRARKGVARKIPLQRPLLGEIDRWIAHRPPLQKEMLPGNQRALNSQSAVHRQRRRRSCLRVRHHHPDVGSRQQSRGNNRNWLVDLIRCRGRCPVRSLREINALYCCALRMHRLIKFQSLLKARSQKCKPWRCLARVAAPRCTPADILLVKDLAVDRARASLQSMWLVTCIVEISYHTKASKKRRFKTVEEAMDIHIYICIHRCIYICIY